MPSNRSRKLQKSKTQSGHVSQNGKAELSKMSPSDVIGVGTPNSSICISDSDESVSDIITVQAQITPEQVAEQALQDNYDPKKPVQYCVPGCVHERRDGTAPMSRCCICMKWYHLPCLNEDEEEGESFWTCHKCRCLPEQVKNLNDLMKSKIDTLYMKLNDMFHVNTKMLNIIEKSNLENKLLRQQLNALMKNDFIKSVKTASCDLNCTSLLKEPRSQTTMSNSSSQTNTVTDKSVDKINNIGTSLTCVKDKLIKVHVVCDSIPSYIDKSLVSPGCNVKAEITKTATTVNEAVDYVQDKADPEDVTVIHTGTRNLRKDTTKRLIQRFERLETNIKAKKLNKVALSSIVHRTDGKFWGKTMVVNRALKTICERNNWCYIDNGNIDKSCLWKDGLHLNDPGKIRLAQNITLSVANFTMFKPTSHT